MPERDIAWLLDKAISWEETAKEMYTRLAETTSEFPPAQTLWTRLAQDEAHHAAILKDMRDALSAEELAHPVDAQTLELVASVERVLNEARSAPLLTLDDAYEVAHDLESSEIGVVFRLLAIDSIDSAAKRALVSSQYDEHVYRLTDFGQDMGRAQRASIPLAV